MAGLARVAALKVGIDFGVRLDPVGQLEEEGGALDGGGPAPRGEGFFRGVGGEVDLFRRSLGDFDDQVSGARIEDGLGIALAGDQFSANEEACFKSQGLGRAFRHSLKIKPVWAGSSRNDDLTAR